MSEFRSPLPEEEVSAKAFSSAETVVFVDVGAKKVDANITRDGIPITALAVNPQAFDEFFTGRPSLTQKVVSQSIAPGTSVALGASVNLVLAIPGRIPVKIIEGVHVDLADRTFQEVYTSFLADNPDVVRILARTPTVDVLTDTDEQALVRAFAAGGVEIRPEAGVDIAAGFQTLKAGLAFGT
jgi:hypothetical protein